MCVCVLWPCVGVLLTHLEMLEHLTLRHWEEVMHVFTLCMWLPRGFFVFIIWELVYDHINYYKRFVCANKTDEEAKCFFTEVLWKWRLNPVNPVWVYCSFVRIFRSINKVWCEQKVLSLQWIIGNQLTFQINQNNVLTEVFVNFTLCASDAYLVSYWFFSRRRIFQPTNKILQVETFGHIFQRCWRMVEPACTKPNVWSSLWDGYGWIYFEMCVYNRHKDN